MLHLYILYRPWFDFVSVAAAFNQDQPISMEFLQHLVQLTEFVTLMPRFTASVPSSWVEVQQDQQRLHQHTLVDPVLHTRTWKVRSDGSRYVLALKGLCHGCVFHLVNREVKLHRRRRLGINSC